MPLLSLSAGDDGSFGERIPLAEDQRLHPVRYVSSHVTLEDEVGQNALHFVVIDCHAKPLEGLGNAVQMNLRLANDEMDPLEEVAVANGLAFLQQQIRSPSNEEVLIFEKSVVEGA
eukprot:CAMPEP_0197721596 /NCGR_PEP_ID=MMETSP1434-20131217/4594_1 /TAXON_ID=265543 /ORGANISM="Minutocellus polymorphus, Strain CCMP3303" /LENGTH=115 /DNA_ID=CAMNT_0043306631 /DNA_START=189 /DNA_END=533 /DNA_ORIENTATION=-